MSTIPTRLKMWTFRDGTKSTAHRMTTIQLEDAIQYCETYELEALHDDPYMIQQLCVNRDLCNVLPEIQHKKDRYFIEDWKDMFIKELIYRYEILQNDLKSFCNVVKKPNILVKWFKFW